MWLVKIYVELNDTHIHTCHDIYCSYVEETGCAERCVVLFISCVVIHVAIIGSGPPVNFLFVLAHLVCRLFCE